MMEPGRTYLIYTIFSTKFLYDSQDDCLAVLGRDLEQFAFVRDRVSLLINTHKNGTR